MPKQAEPRRVSINVHMCERICLRIHVRIHVRMRVRRHVRMQVRNINKGHHSNSTSGEEQNIHNLKTNLKAKLNTTWKRS